MLMNGCGALKNFSDCRVTLYRTSLTCWSQMTLIGHLAFNMTTTPNSVFQRHMSPKGMDTTCEVETVHFLKLVVHIASNRWYCIFLKNGRHLPAFLWMHWDSSVSQPTAKTPSLTKVLDLLVLEFSVFISTYFWIYRIKEPESKIIESAISFQFQPHDYPTLHSC